MLSNLKVTKHPVLAAAEKWCGNGRTIALCLRGSATAGGRSIPAELATGHCMLRSVGFSRGGWCIDVCHDGLDDCGGLRLLLLVTTSRLSLGSGGVESLVNSRGSWWCRHSIRGMRSLASGDKGCCCDCLGASYKSFGR